ncbi:MAG: uncharacterized protein KVP18_004491 [Porospora cf. gigantea A]|uniref:uncharacterized protein n=1 Tax=Porospora cf. gigantea A TaxID=2853593 RepID=UPI003559711E|nr:MAG: hypothetical protein KVP18_004491 [Porospora cf. gigantea A]
MLRVSNPDSEVDSEEAYQALSRAFLGSLFLAEKMPHLGPQEYILVGTDDSYNQTDYDTGRVAQAATPQVVINLHCSLECPASKL